MATDVSVDKMAPELRDPNGDAFQKIVNATLGLPKWIQFTGNMAMHALHWAADQISRADRSNMIESMILQGAPDISKVVNALRDILDVITTEYMKPCIGAIVIQADQESISRQVDITDTMLIIQEAEGANKSYNTDNAVPHPREWRVEGYLNSAAPIIDDGVRLKPTLVFQQMLLDAYAVARKPVMYKSALCVIPKWVLVESYNIARVVEGNNAVKVSVQLKEFVAYTVPFYRKEGDKSSKAAKPNAGAKEAKKTVKPRGK